MNKFKHAKLATEVIVQVEVKEVELPQTNCIDGHLLAVVGISDFCYNLQ